MADRDHILDGLAWATLTEDARVAKLAAKLARQRYDQYNHDQHTKTHVREVVRQSSPPYGRAKYIFEALWGPGKDGDTGAMEKVWNVHLERRTKQDEFATWQEWQAEISTRLNAAYAAVFERPVYEPSRKCPIKWDWSMGRECEAYERHTEWNIQERDRDKGDMCVALTHQGDHVVCLVSTVNMDSCPHVAVRGPGGTEVRTHLRDEVSDWGDAVVSLGGPHILSALAKGKRIETDWVGRRFFIHHDGSDHMPRSVQELPWLTARFEANSRGWRSKVGTITHGDTVVEDPDWADD